MSQEKLQALGLSELLAPKERFRSTITIDSEPYKIGDDVDTFEEAEQKCLSHRRSATIIQVYNDKGEPLLAPSQFV